MTFFHCVNCVILTYAPFVVYYQASGLKRENHFGLLMKSALGFIISSIVKMLLTATLASVDMDSQMSLLNELLYSFTYLIDAMALAYLIDLEKFETLSRVELVALGWSAAEEVASKLMPLLVYSRSPEVDYKWIQFSLDASCDLIFTLSFSLATWMALCANNKLAPTKKEFGFLGLHIVLAGLLSYLKSMDLLSGWLYILVHFMSSLALRFVGKSMYKTKLEAIKA